MGANDHKIKLNKYKLRNLYDNIIKVLGIKTKIAMILNVSTLSLDSYLKQSLEYVDQYYDKIEDMFDIDVSHIDKQYEQENEQVLDEFLQKHQLGSVGDKYKHLYTSYLFRRIESEKHKYIYYLEQDFLDNIKLSDNKDEDNKIKLLILFRRIWDRANLTIDSELCSTVDRHSKSSKNAGLAFKLLERRNQEDLGSTQKQTHEYNGNINVNHQISSFAQYANMIQAEQQKYIEKNDTLCDIVDVEYEKDDEG